MVSSGVVGDNGEYHSMFTSVFNSCGNGGRNFAVSAASFLRRFAALLLPSSDGEEHDMDEDDNDEADEFGDDDDVHVDEDDVFLSAYKLLPLEGCMEISVAEECIMWE